MNYEFLKQKMDKLFSETSPEEFIKKYEAKGYAFIPIKYSYVNSINDSYNIRICNPVNESENRGWLSNLFKSQKNILKRPENIGAFLCNVV